jgi:amino acid permease
MAGPGSGEHLTQATFTWPRALWTLVLAGLMFGLYYLNENRILSEEQIILIVFVAVPVGAFFVSGKGQDMSENRDAAADGDRKPTQGRHKD